MHSETRLLSLLGMFASGRTYSAQELAVHFECTPRTIRRDIAELRELGYVIRSIPGTEGGYRAESRTMLPPLQLEAGEALATAVGLALLRGAGLDTANAGSATEKLRGMLPPEARTAVDGISTAVSVPEGHVPGVDLDSVITLAAAIAARTVATFDYLKRPPSWAETTATDEASAPDQKRQGSRAQRQACSPQGQARRVEPVQLVVLGGHWYLYAWDLERSDWRVFRLDRMSGVHATTFVFSSRDHPDAEAAVSSAVTSAAYRHTVVLRTDVGVEEARRWFPSRAATVAEAADGVRVTFGVDDLRWAAVMVTMTPAPFDVIEPDGLLAELTALADRARSIGQTGKSALGTGE
ncbi:helix-turn-helix transcriptional regulator [Brevibacterium atlanticum]|uniref:helix-turn-helix transcriptional regulator n=1 Tax=Brevibacterium atlanticum TaxID=2697563 RepID=UPI00141F8DFE|nr:WYL domain-containing protein [Brevibacterium atlanticum]